MIRPISVTAYGQAERFIGQREIVGKVSNPQILAMLTLDLSWPEDDKVPWCSAFINYICWWLRLPRSKSLRARSWLQIGHAISYHNAEVGFDIVILKRGGAGQPGPEVIKAPGHVGFFGGWVYGEETNQYGDLIPSHVKILGGNQSDSVCVASYKVERILGVHRIRN